MAGAERIALMLASVAVAIFAVLRGFGAA